MDKGVGDGDGDGDLIFVAGSMYVDGFFVGDGMVVGASCDSPVSLHPHLDTYPLSAVEFTITC